MRVVNIGVDQMDNRCFDLLREIAGPKLDGSDIEWDIEAIAPVRKVIEDVLEGVYRVKIKYTDDSLLGGLNKLAQVILDGSAV